MGKSPKEIFPVIEKYVSKDAMTWIFKDCLSPKDIESIVQQCRIENLQTNASEPSLDLMAREIAHEYYKNPKARELIAHYINLASRDEMQEVSSIPIPEVLSNLRAPESPMMGTGKVGKYLWALLADERPEAINIIPIFILKVLETIRKFTNILQQLQKGGPAGSKSQALPKPSVPRPLSKTETDLSKVSKELEESKKEIKKLEEKNEQLEERVKDLHEQYKSALSEAQQLKHDKNLSSQKIKELEQSIKDVQHQNLSIEELQRKIHQIERESKMLRYEIEKKEKEVLRLMPLKEQNDNLKKETHTLEKQLKNQEALLAQTEDEVYRLKDALKKESEAKRIIKKVVKNPTPRVGIFVDVQNIFYAAKEKFDGRLDFQKLLYETLQGRSLVKATAYVVKTPEINQTNFINTLESLGYEVKARSLKIRFDGSAKGDWDLGIAIDTISLSDKLDVVVLVSGDGDFVDLVRMLQSKNIRVEVASFLHNTSGDLIDCVDAHFILDEKVLLPS